MQAALGLFYLSANVLIIHTASERISSLASDDKEAPPLLTPASLSGKRLDLNPLPCSYLCGLFFFVRLLFFCPQVVRITKNNVSFYVLYCIFKKVTQKYCTFIPLCGIIKLLIFKWSPRLHCCERTMLVDIRVGDVLTMKKTHPCGSKEMVVLRSGMDFKLRCSGCGHEFMVPRSKIEKNIKAVKREEPEQ